MTIRVTLPTEEYFGRLAKVRAALRAKGRDALCLFSTTSILYLTGFRHSPTERPVVLIVPADGEPGLLIPQLEEEHLPIRVPWLKIMQVYPEYPDLRHPFDYLRDLLDRMGLSRAAAGGGVFGLRRARLSRPFAEPGMRRRRHRAVAAFYRGTAGDQVGG